MNKILTRVRVQLGGEEMRLARQEGKARVHCTLFTLNTSTSYIPDQLKLSTLSEFHPSRYFYIQPSHYLILFAPHV